MKKLLYITISIVQAALLAGMYAIEYYARNRMGMMRHMAYVTRKWESYTWLPFAWWTALLLLLVCAAAAVVCIYRIPKTRAAGLFGVLFSLISCGFLIFISVSRVKCYYYIGSALMVVTILQMIRIFFKVRS